MNSSGRVIVTGSVAFDYLMRFPGHFVEHLIPDRLQRLSVSFLVDEMRRVPGGCGPNIAYGLALLGERPLLLASAGHDAAAYRRDLEEAGVDVSGLILHTDVFTASFFVSTDRDQNQIASFYTGAMARARELSIAGAGDGASSLVIVSPNDPAAMERYTEECRRLAIPFLYDPSQQVARLSGEALLEGIRGAGMLIVNDYELGIVSQKTGVSKEGLEAMVPVLVETHGAQGSTICVREGDPARHLAIPAARVDGEAVDPTGVGD
ncbi:MAG TPA: PfkB family carbohydrate kinase, partial [Thermoanaerobaculia bacterium]|nr:PfkB family carbohydrate kinase [Thermoanaerobaculia bacterium]